ncbi:MAG: hypothetical protein INQ03_17555 [Candidatus Heimdallarchaeota archaeon]|nr:hypothetical protein [Candidatus Heimdallarchaeota archaeon]
MSLLITVLKALGLLIAIGVASELLAKGSEILEKKFGAGFTGSVILGFITMLPELIFVLVAVNEAVDADTMTKQSELLDIALGSAVGGNILLFTVGYAMVILLAYYKHNEIIALPVTLKDDLIYLLVASIYLLLTALKGVFTLVDGIILFSLYFVFVIHQYIETKNLVEKEENDDIPDEIIPKSKWAKSISFLIIGGLGILLAAEPFVHAIIEISVETGVSAIILALIISPIASELPEKISAFMLASHSLEGAKVAVANFIGSKVQASTLLFGSMILWKVIATGSSYPVGENFIQIMLAVLTTIVGVWITYDLKLKLKEGWVVLILYFLAIATVLVFI